MSGIMGPLSAIGSIFGVIKELIPILNNWARARKAQEDREKMEEAAREKDRQEAARKANDILRGTHPTDPPTPPPAALILVFILGASLIGCAGQGLRFNPDFCAGDFEKVGCTRENGVFYPANAPAFNREFCMDQQKVLELSELLGSANGINKGRQYLNELHGDVRTSEKKQWVSEGRDVNHLWMLELRRWYRENRIRNAKRGIDEPRKGEPTLEELDAL